MGAMATTVERGNVDQAPAARRREAPEPAARREGPASWGYLTHPALLPTVFAPGERAGEPTAGEEEVAARKA
jgi:hypothetical protein